MSDLNIENIAFSIVGHVGAARSMAMEAIKLSRTGVFDEAEDLLNKAHEELVEGQKEHFKIITQEAQEKNVQPTMLLIHAEDQMMAAETIRDLAMEIIESNKELLALKASIA